MYRMRVPDLLQKISEGLKKPILKEDISGEEIKFSHLKRIDKLFDKGYHYYLDPTPPATSGKEASIFFRKEKFATKELSFGAIKTVNRFEELKISLSTIAKLSDLKLKRTIDKYSVDQDPRESAKKNTKSLLSLAI